MERWAPAKKDTLEALAGEILHNYGRGRAIVAVDGIDGSGKTTFADGLAAAITATGHSAFRASIDDFHRPRVERHARGTDSPEGFYLDSFDYSTFRRVLIGPFRMGGSTAFVTKSFDLATDTAVQPKWRSGPANALLIVDGIFLNRPELRGLWNYSVWLDVPRAIADERLVGRDGVGAVGPRYEGGRSLYWAEASPKNSATAIIDNSDVEHPRRVFADSC